ncbi:tRNA-splicing endonuclease subunit sen54 N-term-domain-containing protein [Sphaerosporella brunnea]|uniref:tRNA-splicing endonuclease subunit sen54 N-term-domain-containing protein n=1 Tax=Sphaerosporella brunnea TaxID=1250544 RepID=A0A5J5ETJ6_9PEZI|nr:tRNA-splicing endonuclease subunit sen54 N-term-domain-containing protein [Sphaerosporella brunnea]
MAEPEADNLRLAQNVQDGDISDETQDFRFLNLFSKSSDHASIPKRGEKDFEPNGTDLQDTVLAESRQAMHDALCGERKHTSKTHVEGIWRPDKNMTEVKIPRGTHFKSLGKADNKGVLWLLPEETIYMVERGNLECWWEDGVPMSLEGAYASCLAGCGGLERYQVYAYLKRAGYILQRAPTFFDDDEIDTSPRLPIVTVRASTSQAPGMFTSIYNSVFGPKALPEAGPLVSESVYRSYESIYQRLSLIPSHHPPHDPVAINSANARLPYRIAYYMWKPVPNFKKSDPPPPDFRISVVNAREMGMPTLSQLSPLFDSVPHDATAAKKNLFQRLKDGYRNVIVAVVDSGVTSFLKFADVGFADEVMYKRKPAARRGGKQGGRGGRGGFRGGGRGGQGGRGRGGR